MAVLEAGSGSGAGAFKTAVGAVMEEKGFMTVEEPVFSKPAAQRVIQKCFSAPPRPPLSFEPEIMLPLSEQALIMNG